MITQISQQPTHLNLSTLNPYLIVGHRIRLVPLKEKSPYLLDIGSNVGIESFNLSFCQLFKQYKTSWLNFLKVHFRTLGNILNQSKEKFKLQSVSDDILFKFIFAHVNIFTLLEASF